MGKDQEHRLAALRDQAEQYGRRVERGNRYYMMLCPCRPVKFYVELELNGQGSISEKRFTMLADALYDLDGTDSEISDTDLGAALTEGRATATMTVEAADPAAAATKALCTVRAAIHAIGDSTPGWEEARSVIRVAPADASDRLFASA